LKQVLILILIVWFPATARASECGQKFCWGAVAIGPDGAYGWSQGWNSEPGAINATQDGCKDRCMTFKTFYNTCGAISVADNGGWGWGWADTVKAAQKRASDYCADNGKNCAPRVWACSK